MEACRYEEFEMFARPDEKDLYSSATSLPPLRAP
jgi:hypothetical protein